jgi:hypothetical protein
VLEYGSGELSLQIASKVKHISVITHDLNQYGKLIENKPENVEALMVPTNIIQKSDDGTFQEFENYIKAAEELSHRFGKFSVVIIRGRARVECAKFVKEVVWPEAKIFIQDYNHPNEQYRRSEYFEIENHLTKVKGEFTLYLFGLKQTEANKKELTDDSKERWAAQPTTNNQQPSVSEELSAFAKSVTKGVTKSKTKKITELPKKEQKKLKKVTKKISKPSCFWLSV